MDFIAAAAGTIVGVSLSIEVWVAGLAAGLFVKRLWMLLVIALLIAIGVQLIVDANIRSAGLSTSLETSTTMALTRAVGILILAFLVRGIRRLVSSRRVA